MRSLSTGTQKQVLLGRLSGNCFRARQDTEGDDEQEARNQTNDTGECRDDDHNELQRPKGRKVQQARRWACITVDAKRRILAVHVSISEDIRGRIVCWAVRRR